MLLSTLNILSKLFCSYGTIHQLTCPGTFQQNGKAEWKLRHILDTIRAFLSAKITAPFWGKATLRIIYAINHIPSPVIQNQTQYECFFGSPLDYHHLCSFSSACLILLQPHEHNKLESRSRLCCFLDYGETQKGYRCYNPTSHRFRIPCNVVFWEHRFFVELSYFRASLSSSFVLDLFPNKAHIPSVRATQPWAWVPCSCSAWRSCTIHSTSSLNLGKIHSCTFTWLSLLHCPCYITRASHLSWGFHWPFMADCNERGTWCII